MFSKKNKSSKNLLGLLRTRSICITLLSSPLFSSVFVSLAPQLREIIIIIIINKKVDAGS